MRNRKIVIMGGGTGTYTVLSGLKKYPVSLKAIVAMTDQGGSSGILRDELGVLPPGDLRQCLVALSQSSETMREVFNYRFSKGTFKGHSLGNLLISALEKMTGSLEEALIELHKILFLKGKVIPVTFDKSNLVAKLDNGTILFREDKIQKSRLLKNHLERLFLKPKAKANPEALRAIKEADIVVIGPGSLYTSILPLFLVCGITEGLKTTKAKIVYNVNLMTKRGHTDNFSVFDFTRKIEEYLGKKVIDFVLFNNKKAPQKLLAKYEREGKQVVFPKESVFNRDKKIFIGKNLISIKLYICPKGDFLKRSLIRHDSDRLAKALLEIMDKAYEKS